MELISQSQTGSLKLCSQRWYYGYELGLTPVTRSVSLNRGTLFHGAMEAFFLTLRDTRDLDEAVLEADKALRQELDPDNVADVGQVMDMLNFFIEWWDVNRHDDLPSWEILEVERKYVLPFKVDGEEHGFPFAIDLLMRDNQNKTVLIDLKTTYAFYNNKWIDLNSQLPVYAAALDRLDINIDYVGFLQIRNRWAKDATYADVVRFTPFEVNQHRRVTHLHEQLILSQKIIRGEIEPVRTANNLVCNTCPFADLCISDQNGYNTNLLIETGYTKKQSNHHEFLEALEKDNNNE